MANYILTQFYGVTPFPIGSENNGNVRIKITSEAGMKATNWMTLNKDQQLALQELLRCDPAFKQGE